MEKKQREKKKHKIIIILFTKRFGFFLSWLFSAWVEFSSFAAAVFFLLLLLIFVFLLLARFTPVMVYFRFCCPISNQHHQPVAHFSGSYIMKLNPGAEAREPSAVRYDAMPTADGSFVFFGWVGNRFCFFLAPPAMSFPQHHFTTGFVCDCYRIIRTTYISSLLNRCKIVLCMCVLRVCVQIAFRIGAPTSERHQPTNQPASAGREKWSKIENGWITQ